MKLISITLISFLLLFSALGLYNCNNNAADHSQDKTGGIELPPPPTINNPSRPGKPAHGGDRTSSPQMSTTGAFAPHPAWEETLNSTISNNLFPFRFERPGEMAPPRKLMLSGVLNTTLATIDFPAFELQLWSNNLQDTVALFAEQLTFEQEMQDVYSFQLTTPNALASGLYYYLVKDENGKLYYANKVIVDY